MFSPKNNPLLFFLAVAFTIGLPAFYITTLQTPVPLQVILFLVGSYGTAIAALIALRVFHNPGESRAFRHRLRIWRANPWIYLLALGLPTIVWLVADRIHSLQSVPQAIQWTGLLAFPLVFITNLGEEIGWRGYALPRLLGMYRPFTASLILGLVWGLFHLTLYWQRPLFAVLFLTLTLPLSVILTWLFIRTGGSVLLTTLFHATYNTWGQVLLPAGGEGILALTAGLMWVVALFLVVRYGTSLSRSPIPDSALSSAG